MSALWQRVPVTDTKWHNLPTQLEVRSVPELFEVRLDTMVDLSVKWNVFAAIFTDAFHNFLSEAVTELAYNGSSLPWTRDDWSFAPIDLSPLPLPSTTQDSTTNLTKVFTVTNQASIDDKTINVTVHTIAVRARLDCDPLDLSTNTSWAKSYDLHNGTYWDLTKSPTDLDTGWELSPQIIAGLASDHSVRVSSPVLPDQYRLACCANDTDGVPGTSAAGYWTPSFMAPPAAESPELFSASRQQGMPNYHVISECGNMTVKWIYGKPTTQEYVQKSKSFHPFGFHYLWTDRPQMAATDCAPRFEKANASVTVDLKTGAVKEYKILDTPQLDPAALSDLYSPHNVTNSSQLLNLTGSTNVSVR